MSYCRWGADSTVYVFPSDRGICCCDCVLVAGSVYLPTPVEMLAHLDQHIAAGHQVPRAAIERLRLEAEGGSR